MTAPTPSSPDSENPQQQHDPWAYHPPEGKGTYDGPGAAGGSAPGTGLPVGQEVRDGVLVALGVAIAGVVLGLLWLWLAPRVPMVTNGEAVYLKHPEGEEAVGADGTFLLLGLGLGALAGAVVFLLRRQGGIGLVVGLALGAVLAALIGWKVGVWLGPTSDLAGHAKAVGAGKTFEGPLKLEAKGALLAFPFAALAVHLAFTAAFGKRDPEPPFPAAPASPAGL